MPIKAVFAVNDCATAVSGPLDVPLVDVGNQNTSTDATVPGPSEEAKLITVLLHIPNEPPRVVVEVSSVSVDTLSVPVVVNVFVEAVLDTLRKENVPTELTI